MRWAGRPPLVAASETRQLEAAYKGHVVLVGDAGGLLPPAERQRHRLGGA